MNINLYLAILFFYVISSCSSDKKIENSQPITIHPIEQAFVDASINYKIPKRFLMAVAYLESRLNPSISYSLKGKEKLTISIGETAFGKSRKELGITENPDRDKLEIQIDAYARWLSRAIKELDLNLPKNPKNPEELFLWVWEIAKFHRQETVGRRNIRTIFAKELITVLNDGYIWQDKNSQKLIILKKEEKQILIDEFESENKILLNLINTRNAEIPSAVFFPLLPSQPDDEEFIPQGIEIRHCPFSLSACLALQSSNEKNAQVFKAHYVIPPSAQSSSDILQLARHNTKVKSFNNDGQQTKSNKIVILLVGKSGRLKDGIQFDVNPKWLTKWQLLNIAELISGNFGICDVLNIKFQNKFPFDKNTCRSFGQGVVAKVYKGDGPMLWGEIPDLDPAVLSAYLEEPGGLSGVTQIKFTKDNRVYEAGVINFETAFQFNARSLDLEKLVRCNDNKLVWAALATGKQLRAKTKLHFEEEIYSQGPNGDGVHFIRARVYDRSGKLIGWDIKNFILKEFEEESNQVHRECYNY